MMPLLQRPWMQSASGRAVSMLEPDPASIDLTIDIPEQLARLARFAGAPRGGIYSVAQHCVLGADALRRETGRDDIALAFLLHDAHEAYLGDITSPVASALVSYAMAALGETAATGVTAAIAGLKHTFDRAIYAAAGLPWPPHREILAEVKRMDARMLMTERDHLMVRPPMRWHAQLESLPRVRLSCGAIKPWPWPRAADEWRQRFHLYRTAFLRSTCP